MPARIRMRGRWYRLHLGGRIITCRPTVPFFSNDGVWGRYEFHVKGRVFTALFFLVLELIFIPQKVIIQPCKTFSPS